MTVGADEPARERTVPELQSLLAGRRRGARRALRLRRVRREHVVGWLFVLPALAMYAIFVLQPLLLTVQYSLYKWDGIGAATFVGIQNYFTVLEDPDLLNTIANSFKLIVFFSFIPVLIGLIVASLLRHVATGRLGTFARTVLFLPQVIPLVAAGIVWSWVLAQSGMVNQGLSAIGLGGATTAWLGDFDWALPAVGLIGTWTLLGLCTVLLMTGMSKIDQALYEAARIDGAGAIREFFAITLPSLRNEIVVCLTVTIIAALAAFDIVYVSTGGGPGYTTAVPGLEIYVLAFQARQVGTASALAVILVALVLVIVLPIQRFSRSTER